MACPWPGLSPAWNGLPIRLTIGLTRSNAGVGQASMMASVALSAPAVPPDTGASMNSMPAAPRVAATACAALMPIVEVSITVLTRLGEVAAISLATAWLTLPSGRERMMMSACLASSALLLATVVPFGARSVLTASATTTG